MLDYLIRHKPVVQRWSTLCGAHFGLVAAEHKFLYICLHTGHICFVEVYDGLAIEGTNVCAASRTTCSIARINSRGRPKEFKML